MFKHILIPLDGSTLAEAAIPVATGIAEKTGAVLTLMHVIEKNAPRQIHGQTHLKNSEEATAYLRSVAENNFPHNLKVDFHVHTTEVSNVAESIVAHGAELHHDSIIMCSHGRGRALRLLMGTIAQKIISLGNLPVLFIHPSEENKSTPYTCESILVPLDGNPEHAKALTSASELALDCDAVIHLAFVVPLYSSLTGHSQSAGRLLPGTMSRVLEISVHQAEEYLQVKIDALLKTGVRAEAHVLRGDPAHMITLAAEKSHIDLIVLGTHGKSGFDAFWEGNVTHSICSQSRSPLLLIPVKEQ